MALVPSVTAQIDEKEIFKVIFYNFFFILIFFIIFEFTLRIFNLSQIQGYKAELYEDKIHRVKPNSEGIIGGKKFSPINGKLL